MTCSTCGKWQAVSTCGSSTGDAQMAKHGYKNCLARSGKKPVGMGEHEFRVYQMTFISGKQAKCADSYEPIKGK